MKRLWTIIGVADVARSFSWYLSLFGLPQAAPAHDDFGQIVEADGTVLLCLHQWGTHGHPPLLSPDRAQPGHGLLLFFRVDDFDETLLRARSLVAGLEEEPHLNPRTGTREFALLDPDGYYVMISALAAYQMSSPPRVVVGVPYTAIYADPIAFAEGDRVEVQREDADYPDWFWCRNDAGKEGWVHASFLVATSGTTSGARNYNALELTVEKGQEADVLERCGGWLYIRVDTGREGWIPESCASPPLP